MDFCTPHHSIVLTDTRRSRWWSSWCPCPSCLAVSQFHALISSSVKWRVQLDTVDCFPRSLELNLFLSFSYLHYLIWFQSRSMFLTFVVSTLILAFPVIRSSLYFCSYSDPLGQDINSHPPFSILTQTTAMSPRLVSTCLPRRRSPSESSL